LGPCFTGAFFLFFSTSLETFRKMGSRLFFFLCFVFLFFFFFGVFFCFFFLLCVVFFCCFVLFFLDFYRHGLIRPGPHHPCLAAPGELERSLCIGFFPAILSPEALPSVLLPTLSSFLSPCDSIPWPPLPSGGFFRNAQKSPLGRSLLPIWWRALDLCCHHRFFFFFSPSVLVNPLVLSQSQSSSFEALALGMAAFF